jgi:competence protein ComGC
MFWEHKRSSSKKLPKMNLHLKSLKTNKTKNGFVVVEALVAALISSILLVGSVEILNRQIEIANRNKAILRIHEEIHYDLKSIRNYARLWNWRENIYLSENEDQEFPEAMTYISDPVCIQFNRTTTTIETSARSDFHNFHGYFPYIQGIDKNNVVISSFSYDMRTIYKIKRRYTSSSQTNLRLDEKPYTIRVTYTVETSIGNQTSTFPFEHNVDVALNAQYSC